MTQFVAAQKQATFNSAEDKRLKLIMVMVVGETDGL